MRYRQNKKFIDPRYFMDEKTDVIKEELKEGDVGFGSSGVDHSAPDSHHPDDMHQKLIDAGVDPGHLNACKGSGDLVKCLWQKNTGYTGAMRKAGLIPAQPGS